MRNKKILLKNDINYIRSWGTFYNQTLQYILNNYSQIKGIDQNILNQDPFLVRQMNLCSNYFHTKITKNYLISYESIFECEQEKFENNFSLLKFLFSAIEKSHQICFIIYFRRQDDFIESYYSQMVKQGKTESFEEFLENLSLSSKNTHSQMVLSLNWEDYVSILKEIFPDAIIMIKSYDFVANTKGIISDFFSIFNLNIIKKSKTIQENKNPGLNDLGSTILNNTSYLDPDKKRMLRSILERDPDTRKKGNERNNLTYNQAMQIYQFYYQDNKDLFGFSDYEMEVYFSPRVFEVDTRSPITNDDVKKYLIKKLIEMETNRRNTPARRIFKWIYHYSPPPRFRPLYDIVCIPVLKFIYNIKESIKDPNPWHIKKMKD